MSYPLNSEECEDKDMFLRNLSKSELLYHHEIKGDQRSHYEFIKGFKPQCLRVGQDTISISEIGKQFLKNGGFKREENKHRIDSRKNSQLRDLTIKEKAQNVFSKPIMIAISIMSFIYVTLDIFNRVFKLF